MHACPEEGHGPLHVTGVSCWLWSLFVFTPLAIALSALLGTIEQVKANGITSCNQAIRIFVELDIALTRCGRTHKHTMHCEEEHIRTFENCNETLRWSIWVQ